MGRCSVAQHFFTPISMSIRAAPRHTKPRRLVPLVPPTQTSHRMQALAAPPLARPARPLASAARRCSPRLPPRPLRLSQPRHQPTVTVSAAAAATASAPAVAVAVAWASAALSTALTIFLLFAIPTLLVS